MLQREPPWHLRIHGHGIRCDPDRPSGAVRCGRYANLQREGCYHHHLYGKRKRQLIPDNPYGHLYGESRLHRHHEPRGPWTGSPCRSNRHTLLRNRRQLEWISSDRNYTGRRYHPNRTEAIHRGRLEAMTAGAEAPVTQSEEVAETGRSEKPGG